MNRYPKIDTLFTLHKMRYFSFCMLPFYFLVLLCFGCSAVPADKVHTFQEALSAYESGNYRQAAALYEQLIGQGIRSGAVYYNLGNAWARADEPVRAVAAYYLAKRYIPGDPHLNANLRVVLTSNGGIPPSAETSLIGLLFFWQNWMGYHTKLWSSAVLAALTFCGGLLCLFSTQGNQRLCRRSTKITITAAALTAIALASAGYDWYRFEGTEQIIVTESVVPRKGNSEQYEPAFVSPIPFGTLAVILDERSGWYALRFPNGQEGWLPQSQTWRL